MNVGVMATPGNGDRDLRIDAYFPEGVGREDGMDARDGDLREILAAL